MKILEQSSRRIISIAAIASLLVAGTFVATAGRSFAATSSSNIGIAIPLYTYPTDGTWAQVIQAKQAYPNVPVAAIINPDSGPGPSMDSNYVQGIQQLQAAGVTVYGYVDTAYGSDSIGSVEANVNKYVNWYHVDGILFDDMNNLIGYENYYATLGSYVSSLGLKSMGNPGTSVPLGLIGTLQTLCVYESTGLPPVSFVTYPGYSPSNFYVIALATPLSASFLGSMDGLVSWVYLTDAGGSNPYDVLPSYFMAEMGDLASLDASPASTTATSTTTTTIKSSSTTTASSTTTTSTATTTTTTSTSAAGGTAFLTVQSVDFSGNQISGLWTTWGSGNTTLDEGYTPIAFEGTVGGTYTATVADYQNYVFCHWADGGTSPDRGLTLEGNQTITAVYSTDGSCATTVTIAVRSVTLSGTAFSGMWLVVTSGGTVVATGYTKLKFTADVGVTYTVTMSDYRNYVFSHWGNGSTNSSKTFVAQQSATLTAYYNT